VDEPPKFVVDKTGCLSERSLDISAISSQFLAEIQFIKMIDSYSKQSLK
jgi:hypothetical protein